MNSNLVLTLGYLNPALNNSALETNYRIFTIILRALYNGKQLLKIYHIYTFKLNFISDLKG